MVGAIIERIRVAFNENEEFALVVHESPDGDCIGAAAFLYHFLTKRLNKRVFIACESLGKQSVLIKQKLDRFHSMYDLANEIEIKHSVEPHTCVVVLDHHTLENSAFKGGSEHGKVIVIDHHFRLEDFVAPANSLYLIDDKKLSTCSILFNIFKLQQKYNKTEALFLHLGMGSDNLNCKRNLGICEVRQIAELAEIIEAGAGITYNQLTSINYETKTGAQFTVESDIYQQKTFFRDRGLRGTSVSLNPESLKGQPTALIAQTFLQFPDIYTMSFVFYHGRIKTLRIYTRDSRLVSFLDASGIKPMHKNYYFKRFDPHEDGIAYLRDLKQGFKDYLASL